MVWAKGEVPFGTGVRASCRNSAAAARAMAGARSNTAACWAAVRASCLAVSRIRRVAFSTARLCPEQIRQKVVLHVLDGLKAVFQGGPSAKKEFVWAYKSLFFATDPVAVDQVGWVIVDAKRKQKGLPPVAQTGRDGNPPNPKEGFDIRQPQHIPLAAALGLGVADQAQIKHRKVTLA